MSENICVILGIPVKEGAIITATTHDDGDIVAKLKWKDYGFYLEHISGYWKSKYCGIDDFLRYYGDCSTIRN